MLKEERKNLIRNLDKFVQENKSNLATLTYRSYDTESETYTSWSDAHFLSYFSRCLRKRTLSEEMWAKIKFAYREISRNEGSIVPQDFLNKIIDECREIYFSSRQN